VDAAPPVRIARVIGRLNVGGPAVQAIHLARRLDDEGFETLLLRGCESPREGSMDYLAEELGVEPVLIPSMHREVGPADVPALFRLVRELRRYRPAIVHTEAAKAGALGRLAALIAFPRKRSRPVLVHTFHGHSLEHYFPRRKAAFFLAIERFLARHTTSVIAVSDEVKHDLVRLGVTSADRIRVIQVGLDLGPFQLGGPERMDKRERKRAEWSIPDGAAVVTLVARVVPIKRVDRFLRIAALLAETEPDIHFVVVGDGELQDDLVESPEARSLGGRLHWAGFERDMPAVCFASDCVVLTSDNEGTPISLVEAQAAGVPAVSTRMGGAASVVQDGAGGRLVDRYDEAGFATAVLDSLARSGEYGEGGRAHVVERFSLDRLATDLAAVYRSLLERR
jgi:glycosyltransferase involved in cell wall biosynthesis